MKSLFDMTAEGGGLRAPARTEADVRKEAVAWFARLCAGDATEAERDAWRHWRDAHPDHQRAWQRFESIQATLQRVPGHIAASTLRAARPERPDRRRVLRGIAGLASAGGLAALSWQVATVDGGWRSWLADYRTGTGEQRSVELADGSRMVLNTRTSVDVAMDAAQRLVRLRAGEILVETAKRRGRPAPGAVREDDARPFRVDTAHGRILALGTRFIVRSEGPDTAVTVLEDAVEIRAAQSPGDAIVLRAGQRIVFTADGLGTPRPADPASSEWTRGSLVVDNWRLEDVVAELARYRRGHLGCDPAVAGIRVSGAFPIADTDKALAVIAKAFPVRVASTTRYWVSLVPA